MGEIFFRFITRHLLICMIGLLISDVIIFKMHRPRFIAAIVTLVAGFVGIFIGGILGLLFASLVHLFIGIYSSHLEEIGSFVVPVIFMVFSYNFVYKRVKW